MTALGRFRRRRKFKKTPKLSGVAVARDTMVNGLSVDGEILRGAAGRDLVTWRIGIRKAFATSNPEYVDHVLHAGVDRYHKSMEYELLRSVLGLNLFTDEDESWRRHRMILNPVMAKRHVRDMFELMVPPVESFCERIDTGGESIEIDMTGEMTELTLDVVGAALFGHSFGEVARKMKTVVKSGLRGAERATRLLLVFSPPVWLIRASAWALHHAPWVPPPLNRLQWVMRTVDKAVWDLINERREKPSETGDLLNLLLSVEDENGNKLPMRRVRDEVTTFMLAGHETTANALSWLWFLLDENPKARERMLAEIDEVIGEERPTFESVSELHWTKACFQEAMRLYPPAWAIPRVAVAEDVIDGHRIPKRATVIISAYAVHHDARWWPEPERFDPERFMGANAKTHHRSAYLPFGGGRRICIGSSFALLEACLIIALMSRRFTFALAPNHPVEPEATLTLRPRYGIKMIGERRMREPAKVAV